jgi:glucan phosphorylase
MKAALNGALNVSVLDGWWPEAFDGENGWGLDGSVDGDEAAQDARHAEELFDTLEKEVVPAFYERDASGVPRAWVRHMKHSLKTIGRTFTTRRMLADYRRLYRA